ncbi:MAG: NADH-quinone oxidoreductase subunit G [Betaproteobacteria bacterium]|nr:NADH-quinone oxidoreductase subunit G [Betaproteobacteria bacterium]
MINLEVDGQAVQVPEGSMVMEATNRLGIYVPHFCWHKKLSIAANCRMCLVQVEKAPKPLPACATPVTEGMKVHTHSEAAVKAQRGVMEFLLINHPLDCPICDQGGECQLQDLAVGYGGSESRYGEAKRVVPPKDIGPLVAAVEMARCIHCTRCVRFGQEIAGVMELGMAGRGEHSEILSFVGRTVDSEVSGNMIDLCPVGALTSKPFRYTARTWELARRRTVSPHCGLGSNLVVHVKGNRVMRALPLENEAINECWLSDKDRFSYEGLNSEDRLVRPMIRRDGKWQETDWTTALEFTVAGLKKVLANGGGDQVGLLASPHSTLEELYLAGEFMRGIGSDHVDFRLRQSDFSLDGRRAGAPWLGMSISEIASARRVLVIGSNLRKDHPLVAVRLRTASRKGLQLSMVGSFFDEPLIPLSHQARVSPAGLPVLVGEILAAAAELKGAAVPADLSGALSDTKPGPQARQIAQWMLEQPAAVFLGNEAQHHAAAASLERMVQALAAITGARCGFLGEAANSVGGYLAKALPRKGGLNAAAMMTSARRAYVLLGCEPELDMADGAAALRALHGAEFVVALSPYQHRAVEYAHVLLPMAPFTETAGTFVNTEGRVQSFRGVVQPLGDARPAWKILRVLGNMFELSGFDQGSAEDVRSDALGALPDMAAAMNNDLRMSEPMGPIPSPRPGLQRIGDVPIHFADPLVRRSPPLQKTADAEPPRASMNARTAAALQVTGGDQVRASQGEASTLLFAHIDDRIPDGCVRIPAGHPLTAGLGGLDSEVRLERLTQAARASV